MSAEPANSQQGPRIRATTDTIGTVLLLGVLACWGVVLIVKSITVPLPPRDFSRFHRSAADWYSGESMYGWSPAMESQSMEVDYWNLNPPAFHLLLLPLAPLLEQPAFVLWTLGGLVCLVGALALAASCAELTWSWRFVAWALFACLAAYPTEVVLVYGQVSWYLMLPVALMFRAAHNGRWGRVGLWLGLLIYLKLFFLLLVPYLMLERQWRALLGVVSSFAAVCLVGLGVFGWDNHLAWMECLAHSKTWTWIPINASLWGFLSRTFTANPYCFFLADISPLALKALWVIVGGAMGVLTLAVIVRDRSEERVPRAFALLLVGCVLFSPLGWNYYYWFALVPLVSLLARWSRQPRARPSHLWLLLLVVVGLLWRRGWEGAFTPGPLVTLTLCNIFSWTTVALWLCLILDALRSKPCTPEISSSSR